MGKIMKWTALILAMVLVVLPLSGCSEKGDPVQDEDGGMGRYMEETWNLPLEGDSFGITGAHKLADGRIGIMLNIYSDPDEDEVEEGEEPDYTPETVYYTTTDGSDWREETPAWMEELLSYGQYINNLHFNSAGQGVATYYPASETDEDGMMMYNSVEVALISPDGTVTVTPIGKDGTPWEDPYAMRWSGSTEEADGEDEGEEDQDQDQATDALAGDQADQEQDGDEAAEDAQDADEEQDEDEDGEGGVMVGSGAVYSRDSDGPEPLNVNTIIMGEDGMVYISDYSNVGRFDPVTGELVQDYLTWHRGFTVAGGQVMEILTEDSAMWADDGVQVDEATLIFLDAESGEEVRRVAAPEIVPEMTGGRYYSNENNVWGEVDGTVYIASAAGIFRLAPEAEQVELLLPGGMSTLSMPSYRLNSFVPHGDSEFLFIYYEDSGMALVNCAYVPDVPSTPEYELTIYALANDPTLAQVVGTYRKQNPDVLVTVRQASSSGEDATTTDDFIRALNTELLAGKGPDLLLLDDMPIESYVEKGVLADLSDIIQPMIDSGELLAGVAGALEQDGEIYAVPTRFSAPTLWGVKEALAVSDSLSDIVAYGRDNPDRPLFGTYHPSGLLLTLTRIYQQDFLNEDGEIDVDALEQYYSDCADILSVFEIEDLGEYGIGQMEDYLWEYRNRSMGSNTMQLAFGEADLSLELLSSFESLLMPNGAMFKRGGGVVAPDEYREGGTTVPDDEVTEVYRPLSGSKGTVFFPSSIIGVNTAGQQELAMDFVRVMLSPAAQEFSEESGFPASAKALDNLVEKEGWMSMVSMEGGYDGIPERQLEGNWPSEAMLRAIKQTLMELETPVIDNRNLVEVVYNELDVIVKGESTPREAAESVAQKSRLMLAE